MANPVEFEGIILYGRDYKENDRLLKVFTDRFGKVMFFIRGANKRGFRLKSALLPFTEGQYVGAINEEGLSFINAAKETQQWTAIASDIFLNAYTTYILNLVDVAIEDHQPNPLLFQKVKDALTLIDELFDPEIIMNIMEIQLLPFFGIAPHLQDCVVCHRNDLPFDYADEYGGIICQNHFHLAPHRRHLDQKTIYYLRLFSVLKFQNIRSIKVGQIVKTQLRALLDELYENQAGVKLKSKTFIDQMSSWGDVMKKPDSEK